MLKLMWMKSKLKIVVFVLVASTLYAATAWAGLTKNEVSQLYVSIFGRASEGEGNSFWQTYYPDMISTANGMLDTDAARDYFGASLDSNQAFIEHIYRNTLSKTLADDPDGIAYWVEQLNDKSRGEVAVSLVGVIKNYAPDGLYYDSSDPKTIAAYNQFTNRLEVSNYMADTVQVAPVDWAVSTSFTGSLIVTDDAATVRDAQQTLGAMAGGGGGNSLADDIEYYMAMVSSVGELSPMVTEVGTLFDQIMEGDSSVVTITPPLDNLDLNNLPQSIIINANFGSGYTPEGSTSVFTGSAVVNMTNIALSETGITAKAAVTATNVKRDGELILNGGMGLSLNVGTADSGDLSVAANVTFTNLQSLDSQVNGGASLSMEVSSDGEITQPITVSFNQLSSSDFQISSGTVTLTPVGTDTYDALFNLDTDQGEITGTVRMAGITGDNAVFTTPQGPLNAGGINLNMNNVTMNAEVCPETPASGNIVFTRGAETSTMTFSNCTYTLQ